MKKNKMSYCSLLLILAVVLFAGCSEESMISGGDNKSVKLYFTTPSLSNSSVESFDSSIQTKGDHSSGEAALKEDKIENLYLLLFDEENGVLMFAEKIIVDANGVGSVQVPYQGEAFVRLAANISPDGWRGKNWETLRKEQVFAISGNLAFPMYAEVGVKVIANSLVIGSTQAPVKLKRSVAKLSVSATAGISFSGFRTFHRHTKGHVFPQEIIKNVSAETEDEPESAYNNGKESIFLPETNNTEEDQTFIIAKATYQGVEGFYRIDIRKDKALINIERNKHYIINFGENTGYGYPTEAEALLDPYNDKSSSIVIEEYPAYDFVYNGNKNYMGFSNSTVAIFGKAQYCVNGFDQTSEYPYEYLLTMIKTDGDGEDVVVLDNDGLNITKKIIDKDGGKYVLLSAPVAGLEEELENDPESGVFKLVRIQYKNLVKSLVVIWKGYYIDCTYSLQHISQGLEQSLTYAEVKPHMKADGEEDSDPYHWIGLSPEEKNADSSSKRLTSSISGGTKKFVQFREHVDGGKIGVKSATLFNEGFRFADVYMSSVSGEGMIKMIFAQANADLSGYFGGTTLAEYSKEVDDGTKYDGYLVAERITDETYQNTNLTSYCKSKNPSDNPNVWYVPSSRQLMGLWLTNNSDSRKTSPMNIDSENSTENLYSSRGSYLQTQIDYYVRAKSFGVPNNNSDTEPLDFMGRLWVMNFSNGETSRFTTPPMVRCVRNLSVQEWPADIQNNKAVSPVSGKQVTMDPAGYLSNDYFNFDGSDPNPITRKIEVLPKTTETDRTAIYTWSNTKWIITAKDIEKEYTLTEAYNRSNQEGGRLPSMRELMLIYIFHDKLVDGGMSALYKDEADGYYEGTNINSSVPNRMLFKMFRYPAADHTAYMHWYWTSTARNVRFTGNDNGSVVPLRINFYFGDVNARGKTETVARDHYRAVKTIE